MSKTGRIFIVCAPSGCGKGTIIKQLLEQDPSVFLSVSATTRAPRPGEVPGESYLYVTKEAFFHLIETDGLLEYAQFCGNFYGTPRAPVEAHTKEGRDVLLEIEIEGAKQVKRLCPDAVSVYILPPSMAELRRRLTDRNTETAEVIERRLLRAKEEIPYARECDYIIVNDTVEKAVQDLRTVMRAAGLSRTLFDGQIDALLSE